ncbi:unknown protein [Simkania negevensis Z]|uniref:Uncharacterized protein n=1 Tax=Simkania negevensis (strain ATCC VR-1471 / DSM 27360 / Z) TaxID=331113 RepID=F8L5E4_SIMNZ|nr:unknown protein [Simkania negevensis Z]
MHNLAGGFCKEKIFLNF